MPIGHRESTAGHVTSDQETNPLTFQVNAWALVGGLA